MDSTILWILVGAGGELDTAAQILVDAGEPEMAAALRSDRRGVDAAVELLRKAERPLAVATLLSAIGEDGEAARAWVEAKNFDKAAACFEKAGKRREAARHYVRAGMPEKAAENLLATGDVVGAAQIYTHADAVEQALDVLAVPHTHPQYHPARVTRARLLVREGDLETARSELTGLVNRLGLNKGTVGVVFMIAELHARQGDPESAKRILEKLKSRGLDNEDIERRIAKLDKAIEKKKSAPGVVSTPAPAAASAPADPLDSYVPPPAVEAPAEEARPIPTGLPRTDRYDFLKKLGQGGMGAVYAAMDTTLKRKVAIKLLLESDLPSAIARKFFFREAESIAHMSHPNIVGIYDYGEIDGAPFIAMEFIEGTDLERMVRKRKILPLDEMIPLCGQLASALDYAHERKVMHRDIKLGNVMVTVDDLVKLMDFGLAKAIEDKQQRSEMVIGTPYYMAPEQIANEGIDHRVDIYALGVLMFRLVTGHLPFETGDVLKAQCFAQPPNPLSYNPDLPKPLVGLILQCLEKRKEDRPPRCGEIVERLVLGMM